VIWTIGHSTRSITEFIEVLEAFDVGLVADVRRYPGSRRLPQFSSDALDASLNAAGIAYQWIPALGGRRRAATDSMNTGWRHAAFKGYADHIATEEFAEGLFELLMLSEAVPTVIMCAEVLWWRCHRRIISDVLVSLGIDVVHIRDAKNAEPHRIRPPARVRRGRLTYPGSL
jgi:uncharacterized protein (DUF488 family)